MRKPVIKNLSINSDSVLGPRLDSQSTKVSPGFTLAAAAAPSRWNDGISDGSAHIFETGRRIKDIGLDQIEEVGGGDGAAVIICFHDWSSHSCVYLLFDGIYYIILCFS